VLQPACPIPLIALFVLVFLQEETGMPALFNVLDKNGNGKFEVAEAAEIIKTLAAIAGEVVVDLSPLSPLPPLSALPPLPPPNGAPPLAVDSSTR